MAQRDLVQRWNFRPRSLYFAVLLPHPYSGESLGEYTLSGSPATATDSAGPWRTVAGFTRSDLVVHLYRRRALVAVEVPESPSGTFDEAIRWAVSSDLRAAVNKILTETLTPPPSPAELRMIPVLIGDLGKRPAERVHWISEGTTSFHFRMYDASIERQALVRVSRHIIVIAGAGARIRQEVVNLVYEKILYKSDGQIDDELVFSFLDGLARYTIPTENSIFLQREFGRLALFLATVQVLVGIWAAVAASTRTLVLVLSISLLIAAVVLTYFSLRRIRLVDWT